MQILRRFESSREVGSCVCCFRRFCFSFHPRTPRMRHSGSVAGTVNDPSKPRFLGTTVTIEDPVSGHMEDENGHRRELSRFQTFRLIRII